MNDTPDNRSMRGWGRYLGDLDQPQTLPEAQLHATMAVADRLLELVTMISDIQMRLARIEMWIEQKDPGYARVSQLAAARFTPQIPSNGAANERRTTVAG